MKLLFTLSKKGGFTLIEVLLSIAILTIVLLSFMKLFTQSMNFLNINDAKVRTTYTAQEIMNNIEVYESLQNLAGVVLPTAEIEKIKNSSQSKCYNQNSLNSNTLIASESNTEMFTVCFLSKGPRLVEISVKVIDKKREIASSQSFGFLRIN